MSTHHRKGFLDGWQAPERDEIERLFDKHQITPYKAAQIIGVSKSTCQRWLYTDKTAIKPKYAHWRLLLLELNEPTV